MTGLKSSNNERHHKIFGLRETGKDSGFSCRIHRLTLLDLGLRHSSIRSMSLSAVSDRGLIAHGNGSGCLQSYHTMKSRGFQQWGWNVRHESRRERGIDMYLFSVAVKRRRDVKYRQDRGNGGEHRVISQRPTGTQSTCERQHAMSHSGVIPALRKSYRLPNPNAGVESLTPGTRKRSGLNLSVSRPYVASSWSICLDKEGRLCQSLWSKGSDGNNVPSVPDYESSFGYEIIAIHIVLCDAMREAKGENGLPNAVQTIGS